jgi:hypothetical protein
MTREITSICLMLCLSWCAAARAQAVANGGVSGTLVSVSVQEPVAAGTCGNSNNCTITTTVFETPKNGHFVLTQVGSAFSGEYRNEGDSVAFSVTNFGPLGSVEPPGPSSSALTFNPGLALPPGASVQCTTTGLAGSDEPATSTDCYMTGVLEK